MSARKRVRSVLHQHQPLLVLVCLWFVVVLIILPIICKDWFYSTYFASERNDIELVRKALQLNDERKEAAELYIYRAVKDHYTTHKHSYTTRPNFDLSSITEPVDIAIGVITINRNPEGKTEDQNGYLIQTTAGLHEQIKKNRDFNNLQMFVCNVDAGSELHEEAVYLSKLVRLVDRFNSSEAKAMYKETPRDIFEKEKDDYIFCLEKALEYKPKYVLLFEDDAVPHDDFFKTLNFLLSEYVIRKGSHRDVFTNGLPWLFMKTYYPDKWSGYSRDLDSIIELAGIALFAGASMAICIILLSNIPIFSQGNNSRTRYSLQTVVVYFTVGALFSIILACAIGRPYLTALRSWSPYLHRVIPAKDCCTQGVLFTESRGVEIAEHLKSVTCTIDFSIDIAMDDYAVKNGLVRHLVRPNLLKHIGMVSTVRSYAKSAAEFLF